MLGSLFRFNLSDRRGSTGRQKELNANEAQAGAPGEALTAQEEAAWAKERSEKGVLANARFG